MTNDSSRIMTGGEAIVSSLIEHGVDTVFGIPGVQLDPLFAALHDARNKIRVIHTRHEQGAGYMALGYAMATGRPGVAVVVPGPGFLNAASAIATAAAQNAPLLCIAGQIPSGLIGKGTGQLHEIPDQIGIADSLCKWAARIDAPEDCPRIVDTAMRRLQTDRRGPVQIEMPMDVIRRTGRVTLTDHRPVPQPPRPYSVDITETARILGAAHRPLIVAGGGTVNAGPDLLAVAEKLQAPVILSRNALGVIDSRHPLAVTPPVGHRLWKEADVVLAVGSRLSPMLPGWGIDEDLRILRIDVDPEEMVRNVNPAHIVLADAAAALAALRDELSDQAGPGIDRAGELATLKAHVQGEIDLLDPQVPIIRAMRRALPEDGFFVEDLTQVGYVARLVFPVYRPRGYINPGYQGTLGYALPTAMGVKMAQPDSHVLAISGDGGFMFNVQELATAAQHGIDIVMVVFNDSAYGNVKRLQHQLFAGKEIAVSLRNPDLMKLADAFGIQGIRAVTPSELETAIRHGFDTPGPTLVEYPMEDVPDPWPFIQMGRARG